MSHFTYATLCSGVECCSLALNAAPPTRGAWTPIFFSEIAPFQSALLAYYYPSVPNLGDMTKLEATESEITNGATHIQLHGRLDLLAGGTPCQDFSTAGKRAGAAQGSGTRSSLCWEYLRLISQLRPRVILWENVTGCLSTNGGGDFSRFVAEIARLGYGVAWRVLDCQYTRVDCWPMAIPQRRNRVWLVGCADGDVDGAAKILFEPKGVLWDTPPRREARQATPKRPTSSAGEFYPTICARTQQFMNQVVYIGELIVAPTIDTNFGSNPNSCAPIEGRIIVADKSYAEYAEAKQSTPSASGRGIGFSNQAYDKWSDSGACATLKHTGGVYGGGSEAIIAEPDHGTLHDTARCLQGGHDNRIGDSANIVASTLTAGYAKSYNDAELNQDLLISSPIGFHAKAGAKAGSTSSQIETAPTQIKSQTTEVCIPSTSTVRRLTPLECERLMGYPDNYTRIPYRGKPAEQCPDGPRYEACGNGWAINCARWVLLGIHRYLTEQEEQK